MPIEAELNSTRCFVRCNHAAVVGSLRELVGTLRAGELRAAVRKWTAAAGGCGTMTNPHRVHIPPAGYFEHWFTDGKLELLPFIRRLQLDPSWRTLRREELGNVVMSKE